MSARDVLESAKAAIWDAHYGKGIAVEYARKVSAEIDAEIARIAAFGPINGDWLDTSLENWFPISAEELSRLRQKPACQYGKDVGMPEYSCATECQLRATPAVTVNKGES